MANQTPKPSAMERIISYTNSLIDRYITDAETRSRIYSGVEEFSRAQPLIASFLAIQFAFAFLPLLTLVSFSFATVVSAAIAALGFCAFWIGVGVTFTLAILTVTATTAGAVWIWGVATWIMFKWVLGLLYSPEQPQKNENEEGSGDAEARIKEEKEGWSEKRGNQNGVYGVPEFRSVDGEGSNGGRDDSRVEEGEIEKIRRDIERSLR